MIQQIYSSQFKFLYILSIYLLMSLLSVLYAQSKDAGFGEDAGFDEDAGFGEDAGFDEEEFSDLSIKTPIISKVPSALRIDGFLRSQWAVWNQRLEESPWAKGRQNLDLSVRYTKKNYKIVLNSHVEYDLLYLQNEDQFDTTQVDEYRFQLIQGEQYAAYFWNSLELFIGRQIVAWGEGDALSTLDHINPRDQREPGVSDIDDIRLAVLMTRLRLPLQRHEIEFLVRHEGNYGLLIPPLADYSPLRSGLPADQLQQINELKLSYEHQQEGVAADTQSYFLRWLYRGYGFDLGLYAAYLTDTQGALNIDSQVLGSQIFQGITDIKLNYVHPYFYLLGSSTAFTIKSFLIKAELSAYLDRTINQGDPAKLSLSLTQVNTLNSLLSVTYTGITDLTMSVEYQHGMLLSDVSDLLIPPTMPILALRVSQVLLRERLNLNVVASIIDPQLSGDHITGIHIRRGGLVRADALYKLTDQFHVQVGYIHYMGGDDFGPFYGLEEHDRIFGQLRWNFTLY